MSKPKIVSDYLDAAVSKGLTASRRKLITQELESHIYDKAEHYIEIGYSEEESFEKAVAEMGEAEAVSTQFDEIYKENGKLKFALAAVIFLSTLLFTLCTPLGAVAPIKSYAPPVYVLLSFVLY
ncbi:MAG: permease prefix domain 1-containing protein, partial [Acutalibacteraceae bacterium]